MADAAQSLQPQAQGWFSRHWKAVVGIGCLGIILLGAAFVLGIVVLVTGSIKSSDVYQQALAKARANPEVALKLGSPIEPAWYLSGSMNVSGPSGDADIAIPISGPKGKGTIYAVAKKTAGEWKYSRLEVGIEGQEQRIDLLGPAVQ